MNRSDLDDFIARHALSPSAIDAAFDITKARPGAHEVRRFAMLLLQFAGVLSLAAGVVFLVAANWSEFGVTARFVLVQSVFLASVALALWKPPPQAVGRYALLMAFIATGALLALFGQTYQTGADVYELFLTWAALGLPFLLAGRSAAICAAWLVVLNTAMLLFFSRQPQGGLLWMMFAPFETNSAVLLLVPSAVNLSLVALAEFMRRNYQSSFTPRWVVRLALAFAFGFLTWSGIDTVSGQDTAGNGAALLVTLGLEAGVALYVLRRRDDVFPLALIAGSFIAISTCALASWTAFKDTGHVFSMALWLIASSTISGRMLMSRVRAWRVMEDLT